MLRCSHVLCKVDDIRPTVRDFEDLGFTVEWGSDPRRAHNALIWFAEGPFIELFELPPSFAALRWPITAVYGRAAGERLVRWARSGEGWRDVALETDATRLSGTRAALHAAGVDVSRVINGRRRRPDGQRVRYQFLTPLPGALPFVVSAYEPPQRPARVVHPNGAVGVARVHLGVSAADRTFYDVLAGEDRWLHPEEAADTRVHGVELTGLRDELDPALLHGAVLKPAREKEALA